VLVGGLAVSLTGTAMAQLGAAFPFRAASPSPKATTSRPSTTPSRSTASPGNSVALGAALQGVGLALGLLPDSAAKSELQRQWTVTSAQIAAGRNPKANLAAFEAAVKESDLAGWEQQALLAATGTVKSLL